MQLRLGRANVTGSCEGWRGMGRRALFVTHQQSSHCLGLGLDRMTMPEVLRLSLEVVHARLGAAEAATLPSHSMLTGDESGCSMDEPRVGRSPIMPPSVQRPALQACPDEARVCHCMYCCTAPLQRVGTTKHQDRDGPGHQTMAAAKRCRHRVSVEVVHM